MQLTTHSYKKRLINTDDDDDDDEDDDDDDIDDNDDDDDDDEDNDYCNYDCLLLSLSLDILNIETTPKP